VKTNWQAILLVVVLVFSTIALGQGFYFSSDSQIAAAAEEQTYTVCYGPDGEIKSVTPELPKASSGLDFINYLSQAQTTLEPAPATTEETEKAEETIIPAIKPGPTPTPKPEIPPVELGFFGVVGKGVGTCLRGLTILQLATTEYRIFRSGLAPPDELVYDSFVRWTEEEKFAYIYAFADPKTSTAIHPNSVYSYDIFADLYLKEPSYDDFIKRMSNLEPERLQEVQEYLNSLAAETRLQQILAALVPPEVRERVEVAEEEGAREREEQEEAAEERQERIESINTFKELRSELGETLGELAYVQEKIGGQEEVVAEKQKEADEAQKKVDEYRQENPDAPFFEFSFYYGSTEEELAEAKIQSRMLKNEEKELKKLAESLRLRLKKEIEKLAN